MPDYLQPSDIVLEWSSDPLSDTTPTWTAVDPGEIRHMEWWAGVDREGSDPEPGGMTVVLKNIGRKWEPYYSTNLIDTQQRFRLTLAGQGEGVWYTAEFAIAYPTGQEYSEVTVTCGDGFEVLALDDLPGLDPPDAQSYPDVIREPWGHYRLGEPGGTRSVAQVRRSRHTVLHGKKRRRLTVRRVSRRYETAAEAAGVAGPSGEYKGLPVLERPGMILGDSDTAVRFGSGQYVRIPVAEDDFIAANQFTIEAWVRPISGSAVIMSGPVDSGDGARFQLVRTTSPSDLFTGQTRDSDTLTSTTAATADVVAHVALTYNAGTTVLYVNGVEEDRWDRGYKLTAHDGAYAFIGNYPGSGLTGTIEIDEAVFYEYPLTAADVAAHHTAGTARGFAQDVAGNRIRDILDDIPLWSVGAVMNTGRNIQPVMKAGQPRLEEIAESMHAEGPTTLFWFDGGGDPRYLGHEWQTIAAAYNTVQHVFSDAGDGIPYLDAEFVIDSETFNEVTASHEGGPEIIVADTDAQGTRGRRAHTEYTDTLLTEDIHVESLANHVLDLYKTPARRPVTLTVDGSHALAQIQTVQPGILIEVRKLGDDQVASRRVTHVIGKRETLTSDRQLICTWSLARGFDPDAGVWRAGIVGYSEAGSTTVAG